MRRRLWELSSLDGVRKCGRVSRTPEGGPTLRVTGKPGSRVAGYAGLVSCGSKSCPCCAAKIGARYADEISRVVNQAHAQGGSAALVTLTLRHHRGQRLSTLWDGLTAAWGRVSSGRGYTTDIRRFGLTGWVRAVEVTHGSDAGWHPHCHVLVLFDTPMSPEMVQALAERWFDRWARALARRGLDAVEHRGGLDARVVSPDGSGALGTYLAKIAHEISGSPTKRGRDESWTPFQIFGEFLATGNADDYDLWVEFEQTARRRRMLTWAEGTRERYGIGRQKSDEEIARDDLGGDDLIALPNETWRQVRLVAEELLTVAEHGGARLAVAWLNQRGLAWHWARPGPRYRPPASRVAPGSRAVLSVRGAA